MISLFCLFQGLQLETIKVTQESVKLFIKFLKSIIQKLFAFWRRPLLIKIFSRPHGGESYTIHLRITKPWADIVRPRPNVELVFMRRTQL